MAGDNSGNRKDGRPPLISVFKTGNAAAGADETLDLLTGREIFTTNLPALFSPARVWESLNPVSLSPHKLAQNGIFVTTSSHPAATAFDILRTRLLHGLAAHGWKRVAITSPTHGCGKSFVAANLALSLARRPSSRTVLVDLDLRHPEIASTLGLANAPALGEFLSGEQPLEGIFRRLDRTLALALNGEAIADASQVLHSPDTVAALSALLEQLDPEVVLYDLPPALVNDDVIALSSSIDAVLIVTDGTKTSPEELRACEAVFQDRIPLMGVVLNRAQDFNAGRYRYNKK